MTFQREAGAIINLQEEILYFKQGDEGHVEFPSELIWDLHTASPGCVNALAHTHPPECDSMSERDELTLRTWAKALHPFPARMIVIAEKNGFFKTTWWLAQLEAKEDWIACGKKDVRKVLVEKIWVEEFPISLFSTMTEPYPDIYMKNYIYLLLRKSYDTK